MELIEWMNSLAEKGAQFSIYKFQFENHWMIELLQRVDGAELKVKGKGKTFQEAAKDCLTRFEKVNSGKVRFDGPLLEHNAQTAGPESKDEIPF